VARGGDTVSWFSTDRRFPFVPTAHRKPRPDTSSPGHTGNTRRRGRIRIWWRTAVKLTENPIFRYGVRRLWKRGVVFWPAFSVVVMGLVCLAASRVEPDSARIVYFVALGLLTNVSAFTLVPWLGAAVLAREHEGRCFEALRLTLLSDSDIAIGSLAAVVDPLFGGYALTIPISILAAGLFRAPAYVVILIYAGALLANLSAALFAMWMGAWQKRTLPAVALSFFTIYAGFFLFAAIMVPATFGSTTGPAPELPLTFAFIGVLVVSGISWASVLSSLASRPGEEMREIDGRPPTWTPGEPGRTLDDLRSDGLAKF
jgi:hypothetical protein